MHEFVDSMMQYLHFFMFYDRNGIRYEVMFNELNGTWIVAELNWTWIVAELIADTSKQLIVPD